MNKWNKTEHYFCFVVMVFDLMTEKLQTTSLEKVYEQRIRVSQSKHWEENGPSTLVRHSLYSESCVFFFLIISLSRVLGLPWWLSGKESACQCRRCRFNSWVGKIPWRKEWQPTPVFLPGKSHRQRSLEATAHGVTKESDMI